MDQIRQACHDVVSFVRSFHIHSIVVGLGATSWQQPRVNACVDFPDVPVASPLPFGSKTLAEALTRYLSPHAI